MTELMEAIQAAVAPDATTESRAAGAVACRTILIALETKPGEPLAAPVAPPASPAVAIASALRGMPAEKLLDLAIARLRAALPAGAEISPAPAMRIPLVPLPGGPR